MIKFDDATLSGKQSSHPDSLRNNTSCKKIIVLTGGGTAGHVYPNVALFPELGKIFDEIHYIGSQNGPEKAIVEAIRKSHPKVTYHAITTAKLKRSLAISNFATPFKVLKGISEAKKIIKKLSPSVIFSKGGFVAYPVVSAGAKYNVPVIVHESDLSVGLANRMSFKHASVICTTFEKTAVDIRNCLGGSLKASSETKSSSGSVSGSSDKSRNRVIVTHTGTPLRKELFRGIASNIIAQYAGQFEFAKKNLLVIGGSSGAKAINDVIGVNVAKLCGHFNILHATGKGKPTKVKLAGITGYVAVEYLENIKDAYAWADVIISRAGSGAIGEIIALKKPALFVPLRTGRGDQIQNACLIEKHGVGVVVSEEKLHGIDLVHALFELLNSKEEIVERCDGFLPSNGVENVMGVVRGAIVRKNRINN